MQKQVFSIDVDGVTITAEFNNLADQATGSVVVSSGETVVLATAVMGDRPSDSPYFPLKVDYEERFYAAGQILGSRFIRREGRPSDEAVLSGRIVDRTIRPLFNQKMGYDVQIVITILSIGTHDPDVLAVIASSLALGTSDIPWNGPVSAVRIGQQKGDTEFAINPTYDYRENEQFTIDLLACGKDGAVNMIEVGAHEVSEEVIEKGFARAVDEMEKVQKWQKNIISKIGQEKRDVEIPDTPKEVVALFDEIMTPTFKEEIFGDPGKKKITAAKHHWMSTVDEQLPDIDSSFASEYFEEKLDELVHREALENDARVDGRGMDEVRPLFAQAGGVSKALHGSGTFFRGGTHILSVLTLGGPQDVQIIEGMEEQQEKRFFHHYNFPPYSVGETGRVGGFNRREIGHGRLAEKALEAVLPSKDDFPYTIRIVSEAMASNGSTSMGSVCASSLALMDAGVPITKPVAGIASGLMLSKDGSYKVLTDIQGPEDHHGDMDFKVAGTEDGVTAIQMDVKVDGIPLPVLSDALGKARTARLHILETIKEALDAPRREISSRAPHIVAMKILPTQIGEVIGPGGKTVNDIRDTTGAEISIEDDGMVYLTGTKEATSQAQSMISAMTREYTSGEKFEGMVTRLMDFGAFVQIGYQTEGLVHVSEIAPWHVNKVSDLLKEGMRVPVVLKEVDDKGRLNFSIKQADASFFPKPENIPHRSTISGHKSAPRNKGK